MEQPDTKALPMSDLPKELDPDSQTSENSGKKVSYVYYWLAYSHGKVCISAEEENDSPIEQVRLAVPITDDPTLPCLTFRTWVLGITSWAVMAFLNQFFGYRQNALYVSSVSAQIGVFPIGKLMQAYLPNNPIRIPGTKWSFSLNPGPFNSKEHVLITIFANSGSNWVYAVGIITIVKAFYRREIHPLAALLLTKTTQLLGYGWAGIFQKFLVDSSYMWWPSNLVQVSLFRTLYDVEVRPKGSLTRLQFFLVVLVSGFAYYIVPNYLFPSITAMSFVCWIWKDSVTAQQIGSGLRGLGVGSFALDWSTVAGFLGSPLATPGFDIINIMADGYGKMNLSIFFVYTYGLSFATFAATISHVALFHGRAIWQQTKAAFKDNFGDVHTRLMKKNYEPVPQWWFLTLLIVVVGISLLTCEGFGRQLQLPYWGLLLAMFLGLVCTLPMAVITATTNQQPALEVFAELIFGYMYPRKPLANVAFKTYAFGSKTQAIMFLSDLKLGHLMKIPPKSMFVVQPLDMPGDDVNYSSIIWGVVGPLRVFGRLGLYSKMNYFFLVGILAPLPVWVLSLLFPDQKWIRLVNMPIILGGAGAMPPARAVNYVCWGAVGIFFNFFVYRRFKGWWARHNYNLSAGLDAGVALMATLCYFTLQIRDINGMRWWGLELDDHCPLASCPTAPGIEVKGCPVFH
ncbi:Oligopeptide transporter 1 [Morella rubra]|uniref:Oligopeptide transporter 1 n=1 Tax=Morella rubra TaxID=262757 RepID=A0A6A1W8V3_9ROSI|nr:Oligopeptide transporter 1 [Morella rubra]